MSKTAIIRLAIVLVALAFFGAYWYFDEIKGYPPPWENQQATTTQQTASLANPASTYCVTIAKGSLEIKDTAHGQIGICHLPDGRSCEEWALFRDGTCTVQ